MSDDTRDNGGNRRPNKGYHLSKWNNGEEDLVFHYNRERRLEKAPLAVQNFYKEEPPRRMSLLRPLVSTRPRAMMFVFIVLASVFILGMSFLGLTGSNAVLDGNELAIQAIRYEGAVIMSLKKTPVKSTFLSRFSPPVTPYTGAVEIAAQPLIKTPGDTPLPMEDTFYHRVFFTFEPEEYFRFSIPFDAEELALVLMNEKQTLTMTVKTE